MKENPSLRLIGASNLEAYYPHFQHLLETCFPHFPLSIRQHFIHQWSLQRLRPMAEQDGFTAIFQGEDSPVGFTLISPSEGGVGTLFWLLVDKDHQGKGLGRLLLKHVEGQYQSQDCHKIKLTAPSLEACQFYQHIGFNVEGFHPRHWHQMDFWSLAKQISRKQ